MVLTETGTNAGYHVIAEARDYLIQISELRGDDIKDDDVIAGHSVAPCPHDAPCPRHSLDTVPCNFETK